MKDGHVSESGTYKGLLEKKGDFADFLLSHMQEQNEYEVDEIGYIFITLVTLTLCENFVLIKINSFRNEYIIRRRICRHERKIFLSEK